MQMMEEELERTRGRGQGLARELGSAVGGREQAKSVLPLYVTSEPSHRLSQGFSREREVERGRQELTGRVAGHELVKGNAGKRGEGDFVLQFPIHCGRTPMAPGALHSCYDSTRLWLAPPYLSDPRRCCCLHHRRHPSGVCPRTVADLLAPAGATQPRPKVCLQVVQDHGRTIQQQQLEDQRTETTTKNRDSSPGTPTRSSDSTPRRYSIPGSDAWAKIASEGISGKAQTCQTSSSALMSSPVKQQQEHKLTRQAPKVRASTLKISA
jgi:hypothetical protein